MTNETVPEPDVIFEQRGRLGLITLNRPRAINALNHAMVISIHQALSAWRDDDTISTVAIVGSGERGLCAGGDIVSIYREAQSGDLSGTVQFWRDEYALNIMIANYPKPYVAVMDGIVLGGGIGISAHGSHRIVTERTKVGMPETGIGFVPDVGGTWLLSHAPGELGTFLALTAGSASGADAIALGLADWWLPSSSIEQLLSALERADAGEVVLLLATEPPASTLLAQQEWIDRAFAGSSVQQIVERLHGSAVDAARDAANTVAAKSPTALAVTLESLRRAKDLDLTSSIEQEFRVSLRAVRAPDFAEGVRAQVIDKDRSPKWRPAEIDAVDASLVEAYFESLGDDELVVVDR
ncbi:enoyl-CoA hydratase/isomerase family protein [Subtercola endophyticus]|uniref:enoyl-CoA hydratase/isomerase family protein n=1 Tax=Subtercola endophyticus TaxID=2895559 RepID=UPI001E39B8DD|nr:enoyl-CoA hydratase/isomerase family protein [Subtercola endophyticus]UFS58127.1 enoyl-CoA hydratase/isomerase family protein [Subtercola endophyticus]